MMDKTPFYQSRYSMKMIDKAIVNQSPQNLIEAGGGSHPR
jgi:hypothetical protein